MLCCYVVIWFASSEQGKWVICCFVVMLCCVVVIVSLMSASWYNALFRIMKWPCHAMKWPYHALIRPFHAMIRRFLLCQLILTEYYYGLFGINEKMWLIRCITPKTTNFHHIYSDFTLIMSNFALPWVNYNNNKYNF